MNKVAALNRRDNCIVVNGDGISVQYSNKLSKQLDLSTYCTSYENMQVLVHKDTFSFKANIELFNEMLLPYTIIPPTGIWINNKIIKDLGTYFGIKGELFFLLFTLMGTIQLKSLLNNELLQQEDLIHNEGCNCIFSSHINIHQWLIALEDIHICSGSDEFYNCLGCENEIISLKKLIKKLSGSIS